MVLNRFKIIRGKLFLLQRKLRIGALKFGGNGIGNNIAFQVKNIDITADDIAHLITECGQMCKGG